jgi:hypothetical protein
MQPWICSKPTIHFKYPEEYLYMTKRLIADFGRTDPTTLEDLLLVMANNIEASLLQAGATPGEDYSFRDLYNWATPFALEVFRNDKANITFAVD